MVYGFDVSKSLLPSVGDEVRSLGLPTIMDVGLAQRFGVAYVHFAAMAIEPAINSRDQPFILLMCV